MKIIKAIAILESNNAEQLESDFEDFQDTNKEAEIISVSYSTAFSTGKIEIIYSVMIYYSMDMDIK